MNHNTLEHWLPPLNHLPSKGVCTAQILMYCDDVIRVGNVSETREVKLACSRESAAYEELIQVNGTDRILGSRSPLSRYTCVVWQAIQRHFLLWRVFNMLLANFSVWHHVDLVETFVSAHDIILSPTTNSFGSRLFAPVYSSARPRNRVTLYSPKLAVGLLLVDSRNFGCFPEPAGLA